MARRPDGLGKQPRSVSAAGDQIDDLCAGAHASEGEDLHIGQRSFLLHQTISALEQRLDPALFIRLHRSTIVRRDRTAKLRHDGLGTWYATLANGNEVRIGRSYLANARALTGRA